MSDEETQKNPQDESAAPQVPALPEIDAKVEDAGTLKKKVIITVPQERIDAKRNEMFGELAKSALVPGFRIGHAPRRLIEKRFGHDVGQDVRNSIIGESIGAAIEKTKLATLGEPDLDLDKIELPEKGEMTFSFEVEVAPEFEMPNLEGIEVKKPKLEINDDRVNEQIEQWRQSQAKFEATTEAVKAGDVVTADVRITGEGINEHHHKDHVVRVAPGQVEGIPLVDLAEVLAGKKTGEAASVTVKVPAAHPNEEWREKEVTVTLTISQVRGRILPEINEEFAKQAGFENIEALRAQIRRSLESRLAQEVSTAMRDQVRKYLLESTKFDLPAGVAAKHANRVLQRRYVDLLYRGVPREKIDENLAQLQAAAEMEAKTALTLTFILAKVAEKEEIKVEEGEVNARIAAMAHEYNRRPERMRQELEQEGTLGEIKIAISEEKALDKLLEKAKVTEITAEEMAEQAKAEQEKAAAAEKKAEKAAKPEKKADEPDAKAEKPEKKAHKKAEAADEKADEPEKKAKKSKKKAE